MGKYFWREKNANSCIKKGEVTTPTREELEKELILKFEQKLSRIDIIFDKNARMQYYLNDKKPKTIKLEGLSEQEIQHQIGKNVVADFIQVTRDICQFYEIDFDKLSNDILQLSKEEIVKKIRQNIDNLLDKKKIAKSIETIYLCSLSLANLLNIDVDEIEKTRKEREEKEGNFFNGKYVVIDLK